MASGPGAHSETWLSGLKFFSHAKRFFILGLDATEFSFPPLLTSVWNFEFEIYTFILDVNVSSLTTLAWGKGEKKPGSLQAKALFYKVNGFNGAFFIIYFSS